MWLFRRSLDINRATPRTVNAEDLTAVSRLLRDGARRYFSLSGGDLSGLLGAHWGVGLELDGELCAVAVVSWPSAGTCWLRGLALAEGAEVRATLAALLPALHHALRAAAIHTVFYAGDETADAWLVPGLRELGYVPETEVVVYEKQRMDIPDGGNLDVQVRPATSVDLAEVIRLDQICFEPQWTKDDAVLGPAVEHGPYFVVAIRDNALVGYAYATAHFGGRLLHLVRIAVHPASQGARIGVRLMADLITYAGELNANVVTLNTQAYNAHAQRLYRWFGFAPTGERQTILRYQLEQVGPGLDGPEGGRYAAQE